MIDRINIIKARYVNRNFRLDDEDDQENTKDKYSGNTRIPYGLCQKFGIKIGDNWLPSDCWDALKGIGINKEEVLKELSKTGTVKNVVASGSSVDKAKKSEKVSGTHKPASSPPPKKKHKSFSSQFAESSKDIDEYNSHDVFKNLGISPPDDMWMQSRAYFVNISKQLDYFNKKFPNIFSDIKSRTNTSISIESGNSVHDGEVKEHFAPTYVGGIESDYTSKELISTFNITFMTLKSGKDVCDVDMYFSDEYWDNYEHKPKKYTVEDVVTDMRLNRGIKYLNIEDSDEAYAAIPMAYAYSQAILFKLFTESKGYDKMSPREKRENFYEFSEKCVEEILDIARKQSKKSKKTRNWDIKSRVAFETYGSGCFAAGFINFQLGKPDDFGKATKMWLKKKGITAKD